MTGRVAITIADGILAAPDTELVSQPQWAVPAQPGAPLLFTGAALAVVVTAQAGTPGFAALATGNNPAATSGLAGLQVELHLPGRQTPELIHRLFKVTDVEWLPGVERHQHAQFVRAEYIGTVQPLCVAFDHLHLQGATGKVLRRQVGTGSYITALKVSMGNILQQQVKPGSRQALMLVRVQQPALCRVAKPGDAEQLNTLHVNAVAIGRQGINTGARQGTGQALQFVQPLLLLLQQTLLALAGQVAVTG